MQKGWEVMRNRRQQCRMKTRESGSWECFQTWAVTRVKGKLLNKIIVKFCSSSVHMKSRNLIRTPAIARTRSLDSTSVVSLIWTSLGIVQNRGRASILRRLRPSMYISISTPWNLFDLFILAFTGFWGFGVGCQKGSCIKVPTKQGKTRTWRCWWLESQRGWWCGRVHWKVDAGFRTV